MSEHLSPRTTGFWSRALPMISKSSKSRRNFAEVDTLHIFIPSAERLSFTAVAYNGSDLIAISSGRLTTVSRTSSKCNTFDYDLNVRVKTPGSLPLAMEQFQKAYLEEDLTDEERSSVPLTDDTRWSTLHGSPLIKHERGCKCLKGDHYVLDRGQFPGSLASDSCTRSYRKKEAMPYGLTEECWSHISGLKFEPADNLHIFIPNGPRKKQRVIVTDRNRLYRLETGTTTTITEDGQVVTLDALQQRRDSPITAGHEMRKVKAALLTDDLDVEEQWEEVTDTPLCKHSNGCRIRDGKHYRINTQKLTEFSHPMPTASSGMLTGDATFASSSGY